MEKKSSNIRSTVATRGGLYLNPMLVNRTLKACKLKGTEGEIPRWTEKSAGRCAWLSPQSSVPAAVNVSCSLPQI